MSSPVVIENHTATGAVDMITVPNVACSVAIRGTADVLLYDEAQTAYFTIEQGVIFIINTHNLGKAELYLKATAGTVIQLCYQDKR